MRTTACCVMVCVVISCLDLWYLLSVVSMNLWYLLSVDSNSSATLPRVEKAEIPSRQSLYTDKQFARISLSSKGTYKLVSSDPEVANATTLLVMSDTRDLETSGYHRLAFLINSRYATLQQATSIVFVHTPCLGGKSSTHRVFPPKKCVACFHKQHGGRAAPWCKLPALRAVMETYPKVVRFVYIDSDAFVSTDAPLPSAYFQSTLNVFNNYPYITSPACSGIMFWKAGPEAMRMLQEWWDTPGHSIMQDYNMHHDYDQSAFRTSFWQRNRASIHVISEITIVSQDNQKFRHLAGYSQGERELLMQEVFENIKA